MTIGHWPNLIAYPQTKWSSDDRRDNTCENNHYADKGQKIQYTLQYSIGLGLV